MTEEQVKQTQELCDRIAPLFSGRDPRLIGAVLAELTAAWLTGHLIPEQRGEAFGTYLDCVVTLAHVNVESLNRATPPSAARH